MVVGPGATAAQREAVEGFAEQFSADVSAVDRVQRAVLTDAFGDRSRDVVAAVYVADWAPRVRAGLDALFVSDPDGPTPLRARPTTTPGSAQLWAAIDDFRRGVDRLSAVDPLTAELVRLRAARHHGRRRGAALRSGTAPAAGDEQMSAAVDHHADRTLSGRHRAALALTDALIWRPAQLPAEVVDAVQTHFTAAEAVGLVLGVMRDAGDKIAVATGADAARAADDAEQAGDVVFVSDTAAGSRPAENRRRSSR